MKLSKSAILGLCATVSYVVAGGIIPKQIHDSINSENMINSDHILTQEEAREKAIKFGSEMVDIIYTLRKEFEAESKTHDVNRAKDDFGDDDYDPTKKILSKTVNAVSPSLKEFTDAFASSFPKGPKRQMAKATGDLIGSVFPIVVKYVLPAVL